MKRIPLTMGKEALVDDEDYEYLTQWKWRFNRHNGYAQADVRKRDKRTTVYMHSLVAQRRGLGCDKTVDHCNRKKLDNRRSNLRSATHHQQKGNCGRRRDNTSGYRGVRWQTREQKWQAMLLVDGVGRSFGYYSDPRDAARAYNKAAIDYFGEFAVLNPV